MSNVVAFQPRLKPDRTRNLSALLRAVADHRRQPGDVMWLKENAEALCTLAATGSDLEEEALAPFEAFYDGLEEQLRFYPQYYRFFVSICLDLEDLGMVGNKGQALCKWVAQAGLAQAELSDLQRAEARRLLARRGCAECPSEGALGARLRAFVERPATFALPNKKAAYELTHIVFYLSQYGQKDPQLSEAALVSLEFTGLIAFLDQNHDLLAEICTALRFAGRTPSPIWEQAVARAHASITPMEAVPGYATQDGYHAYLVTGWAQSVAGQASFEAEVPTGGVEFVDRMQPQGALRDLSESLYALGPARSADWEGMRGRLMARLDPHGQLVLQNAEHSSPRFDAFFAGFARACSA